MELLKLILREEIVIIQGKLYFFTVEMSPSGFFSTFLWPFCILSLHYSFNRSDSHPEKP